MDNQNDIRATGASMNPVATGGLPREDQIPALATFFYLLGALEILGGIVLFFKLLPGDSEPGYVWLLPKYMPSITWLITGVVSGSFTFAVAEVLRYLKGIHENTKPAQKADSYLQRPWQERALIDEPSTKNEAADSCIVMLKSIGYKVTNSGRDKWVAELSSGGGKHFFYSIEELQDFTERITQARSRQDLA